MAKNPWFGVGWDAWSLGVEAAQVIALRSMTIAWGGQAADTEAHRMVSEKVEAGLALQAMALTGQLGLTADSASRKTLAHYRRKVRANRRRLTKG